MTQTPCSRIAGSVGAEVSPAIGQEMTETTTTAVLSYAELAHRLIHELHARDPKHATFSQVGLLDGRETVAQYVRCGELGCALHHLLYMVHESAIAFPRPAVVAIHQLAEKLSEPNHYSPDNVARMLPEHRNCVFNALP